MNLEQIQNRYNLLNSKEYQEIRKEQLNYIVALSAGQIDPLELKGMLKLINSTDKWQDAYNKEKKKREEEEKEEGES